MAEMKLTALQRETLSLIEEGKVYQAEFGYAAWRIQGASPQAVGRLISLGLAKWGAFGAERIDCLLTDTGRSVLTPSPQPREAGQ